MAPEGGERQHLGDEFMMSVPPGGAQQFEDPLLAEEGRTGGGGATSSDRGRIRVPGCHDVLCGRSRRYYSHPGNVFFREMISLRKDEYCLASTRESKTAIVRDIMECIDSLDPPGRFLIRDESDNNEEQNRKGKDDALKKEAMDGERPSTGFWVDAGSDKAFAKTSQALREGAPKMRESARELLLAAAGGSAHALSAAALVPGANFALPLLRPGESSSRARRRGGASHHGGKKRGYKRSKSADLAGNTDSSCDVAAAPTVASSASAVLLRNGGSGSASEVHHLSNLQAYCLNHAEEEWRAEEEEARRRAEAHLNVSEMTSKQLANQAWQVITETRDLISQQQKAAPAAGTEGDAMMNGRTATIPDAPQTMKSAAAVTTAVLQAMAADEFQHQRHVLEQQLQQQAELQLKQFQSVVQQEGFHHQAQQTDQTALLAQQQQQQQQQEQLLQAQMQAWTQTGPVPPQQQEQLVGKVPGLMGQKPQQEEAGPRPLLPQLQHQISDQDKTQSATREEELERRQQDLVLQQQDFIRQQQDLLKRQRDIQDALQLQLRQQQQDFLKQHKEDADQGAPQQRQRQDFPKNQQRDTHQATLQQDFLELHQQNTEAAANQRQIVLLKQQQVDAPKSSAVLCLQQNVQEQQAQQQEAAFAASGSTPPQTPSWQLAPKETTSTPKVAASKRAHLQTPISDERQPQQRPESHAAETKKASASNSYQVALQAGKEGLLIPTILLSGAKEDAAGAAASPNYGREGATDAGASGRKQTSSDSPDDEYLSSFEDFLEEQSGRGWNELDGSDADFGSPPPPGASTSPGRVTSVANGKGEEGRTTAAAAPENEHNNKHIGSELEDDANNNNDKLWGMTFKGMMDDGRVSSSSELCVAPAWEEEASGNEIGSTSASSSTVLDNTTGEAMIATAGQKQPGKEEDAPSKDEIEATMAVRDVGSHERNCQARRRNERRTPRQPLA